MMSDRSVSRTPVTLLGRLASGAADGAAWEEFVDRYGPHILQWCRGRGCPESELEDVLQEVLLKLMQAFQSFRYDPKQRFRNWLATVSRNTASDLVRSRRNRIHGTGDPQIWLQLESKAAQDDLLQRLSAAFDMELFIAACQRVKERVRPDHWQAFELASLRQQSPIQAASELGIPIATFYVSRSRVLAQVKAEVTRLQSEFDGDGGNGTVS